MDWTWQIKRIALLLALISAFGILGLMVIEGWSFLDALYMTFITLSTVGYEEVHPLSPGGKLFMVVFIIMGVGLFFYIITSLADFVVSGRFGGALGRRRMEKKIDSLKDHHIICGFGRVGQQVALELKSEDVPFLVIDSNAGSIAACKALGYLYIQGDASDDEVLKQAGIDRARGLVTATDADADNVFITLSARALNPRLIVVARANAEKTEYKLRKAGANRVISPYSIGGRRLASVLLRPTVVEFLDIVMHRAEIELLMEEISISEKSPFVEATIGEARQKCLTGANILAIKKVEQNKVVPNPSPDIMITKGDRLVVIGTRAQLRELEGLT